MEYKDPGRYIPIIYLLYSWGSLFGVPSRVPLLRLTSTVGVVTGCMQDCNVGSRAEKSWLSSSILCIGPQEIGAEEGAGEWIPISNPSLNFFEQSSKPAGM